MRLSGVFVCWIGEDVFGSLCGRVFFVVQARLVGSVAINRRVAVWLIASQSVIPLLCFGGNEGVPSEMDDCVWGCQPCMWSMCCHFVTKRFRSDR